jgi:hypothetical protein
MTFKTNKNNTVHFSGLAAILVIMTVSNFKTVVILCICKKSLGSCCSIFSFMCIFCRSLFVLLSFFFWPLCLQFTDSDYPFGIFKLFLHIHRITTVLKFETVIITSIAARPEKWTVLFLTIIQSWPRRPPKLFRLFRQIVFYLYNSWRWCLRCQNLNSGHWLPVTVCSKELYK